jgi:hypothetical protein
MFSSKLSVGLVALALVSVGSIGCAADTSPEGDGTDVEESADELTAAGKALIGSYKDDSGAFKSLVLSSTKAGQRNAFSADVDTGIRCIKAPCPSSEHIEGTFTAGSKTITLYSTTASGFSKHLLGKYNYLVQGAKFSLSRKDFAQSLERLADIWPSDATKLVAKQSGGFMPPPPAGSTCTNQHEYSLTLATRKLSYSSCEFNGNLPRHLKTGTVTLTSAQLAKVNAAMNAVEIATRDICGADKPFETLTVSSPAGDKKYVDSFYSCQGGENVYIDNIGGVFGALRDAAGH